MGCIQDTLRADTGCSGGGAFRAYLGTVRGAFRAYLGTARAQSRHDQY